MKEIKDQFKNEFQSEILEGDSFYIDDAAERPLSLVPYGEPVQEVILEELGTTVEGESVIVTGGNPEKEVKDTIYGMSKQNTTEGINELNLEGISGTSNGVTYKVEKGILILNGDLTGDRVVVLIPGLEIDGTYTFYANKTDLIVLKEATGSNVFLKANGSNVVTVTDTKTVTQVHIYGTSGTVYSNAEYKLMLVEGSYTESTIPPFEIFTNGVSTPNTDYEQPIEVITECRLVQSGKNYFKYPYVDTTKTEKGITCTDNGDGSVTLKGIATGDVYFILVENAEGKRLRLNEGKYKCIIDNSANANISIALRGINTLNLVNNQVFDFYENDYIFGHIYIPSGTTVDGTVKIMLIPSNVTNTDYEPYIEPIVHSIDLQGNTLAKVGEIADLLNIGVDGRVSIKKNINKVLGTELINGNRKFEMSTSYSDDTYICCFYNWLLTYEENSQQRFPMCSPNNKFILCNKLLNGHYVNSKTKEQIGIESSLGITLLRSRYATIEEVNNLIKDEDFEFYYSLAKPTTIELPSIKPIELFEGITNVFELVTNLGTTMVLTYDYITPSPSIDRPSEILTIEGSYSTELQNEYATITNTLPLTLTKELLGEIIEEDGEKYYSITHVPVVLTGDEISWQNYGDPTYDERSDYDLYTVVMGESSKLGYKFKSSWDNIIDSYCTHFKNIRGGLDAWQQKKIGFTTDGSDYNRICICTDIKPLSDFKAKVKELYEAGTPITFRMRIVTPIKIKITDETELEQLSVYDKQIAFFGINNINTYSTDDLVKAPLKLKVTYDKSNRIL